eukprot:6030754-Pyramimonas_sp.AAC.1
MRIHHEKQLHALPFNRVAKAPHLTENWQNTGYQPKDPSLITAMPSYGGYFLPDGCIKERRPMPRPKYE